MLCSLAFVGTFAIAAPTAADVTLNAIAADEINLAPGVNPHGSGNDGFTQAFGTGWDVIGGFERKDDVLSSSKPFGMIGSPLKFTFAFDTGSLVKGTWSVENTNNAYHATVNLVFAMHTGGGSGAWLFENRKFLAGTTQFGEWNQTMRFVGKSKSPSAFSNVTFFSRDLVLTKVPDPDPLPEVPEPATLGTLMLGLGMIGFMARRRKQS